MIESLLLKSVSIVSPEDLRVGDVYIEHGRIAAMDWVLTMPAEVVLRDSGLTLMPGVIDPHVHFREPGACEKETLETGSRAAVSGGVTSFIDMPNTNPATTTLDLLNEKLALAAKSSLANYHFFLGATPENADILMSARDIPGIKVFMGSSTGSLLVAETAALSRILKAGECPIVIHAEDNAVIQRAQADYQGTLDPAHHARIRPVAAATAAIERFARLNAGNRAWHVAHLSSREEVQLLAKLRTVQNVTTEVSPHHLFLTADDYAAMGTLIKANPPIRDAHHQTALWQGLRAGIIDMIATDHAPHLLSEKIRPYPDAPSGVPGVETALPLMLTAAAEKRCTLHDLVGWMSSNPAHIFRIPNKGQIRVGYDADLVLVDLQSRYTLKNRAMHTKCGWTPFDGKAVQGRPIVTIVNGQIAYREGDFSSEVTGKQLQFL